MKKTIDSIIKEERGFLPTRKALFDEEFADEGGIARVEEFDHLGDGRALAAYVENLRNSGVYLSTMLRNRGSNHRIHCDFIHSPELNACAVRHSDDLSFVGISLGLYLRLRLLLTMLSELCAHQDPLPFRAAKLPHSDMTTLVPVGRFAAEEFMALMESSGDPAAEWDKLRAYRDDRYSPRSEAHARQAKILTTIAVDYVAMHEQVHIGHGHVGYVHAAGLRGLDERPTARVGGESIDLKVRRGCESMADYYAGVFAGLCLRNKNTTVSTFHNLSHETYLYYWAFAVAASLNALDLSARSIVDYDPRYPHPEMRYILVAEAIGHGISGGGAEAFAPLWKKMDAEGMKDCRRGFERAGLPGRAFVNLSSRSLAERPERTGLFQGVLSELSECETLARDECQPFALPLFLF